MIINKATLAALFIGFNAAFKGGFQRVTNEWETVATLVPSSTSENQYAWLGQFPQIRKWVGDRVVRNMEAHSYTIKNDPFESTIAVPKATIEDDQFGVFNTMFDDMGYAAAAHPNELVFGLLAAGFTTTCFDGQYFFDTDHPVGTGVVSNMQAGAGNPWFLMDTRRPLKPIIFQRRRPYEFKSMTSGEDEAVFMRDEFRFGVDARVNVGFGFWQQALGSKAALDAANFNAGVAAMQAFLSDEGRPLGIRPNILVCGPTNRAAALEVVKAERNAAGATNINQGAVEVVQVPWLT
ncbi:MAG: Mu-like prophage major head subunit gpT family protein [Nitrospirota bacterium]|nr:Mu-like prophage major head subunit gpT family protein [Nitrospirota bacterium]